MAPWRLDALKMGEVSQWRMTNDELRSNARLIVGLPTVSAKLVSMRFVGIPVVTMRFVLIPISQFSFEQFSRRGGYETACQKPPYGSQT